LRGQGSDVGPGRLLSLGGLVRGAQDIVRRLAPETGEHVGAGLGGIEGVGWATVELDRAAEEFRVGLGLPRSGAFRDGPPDGFLGAHTRLARVRPSGLWIVLVEPSTEGRLAAFLARHGEGIAAAYVAGPVADRGWPMAPDGRDSGPRWGAGGTPPAWTSSPLGSQRLLAGGRFGPWVIRVDEPFEAAPGEA
jgi:hypothetical protein